MANPRKLNIYLSERDQENLDVIAYIMADQEVDGTIRADQTPNRSRTMQEMIADYLLRAESWPDTDPKQIRRKLIELGIIDGKR